MFFYIRANKNPEGMRNTEAEEGEKKRKMTKGDKEGE